MPYQSRINAMHGLTPTEKQQLTAEFDAIRRELNDIRGAYMALRALLVASTAPGAGYNTNGTNLGDTASTAAATTKPFTAT